MLRVLTLSSLYPDESRPNFGVFVEQQTQALAGHPDVDVMVIAPLGIPPWPLRMHPRYRELAALPHREGWRGLDVHRPRFLNVPGGDGGKAVGRMVDALVPYLTKLRRRFAFDVIDAEFFFPDGCAAVELGKRFDVPVSIKARGADVHYWGHQRATADTVVLAGFAAGGLLAVSDAMRRDMMALGWPGERITVHRTGIDRTRFTPVDRAAAKGTLGVRGPLVVAIGALIERKAHHILIGAAARLPGVTLWIAGEGPARAKLAKLIETQGLGDRVRLLGAVPHRDLPLLLAAADVSALASVSEGLANVWIESLACGTPIVISGAGGAAEVVATPAAGRIVARRPEAFATAIGELLADPPATAAVVASINRFSWPDNTVQLYRHLSKLVRAHPRGVSG